MVHSLINTVDLGKHPIIFDIGCSICHPDLDDFTQECLNLHHDCKVVGVDAGLEVHWKSYEQKYKEDDRVVLIKKALSDKIGQVPFYTFDETTGISSLFNREVFSGYTNMVETVVECTTIDDLCTQLKVATIDYLKIDAEGSELNILKGAKKMLHGGNINNIQVEFHNTLHTTDAGFCFEDLENLLTPHQFKVQNKITIRQLFIVVQQGEVYNGV